MGDSAHTTHHTNPGKNSAPPFSRRWEHFSKIGSVGCTSISIPGAANGADFWKKFSSSRKRGGADFPPGFVWWVVWAESPIQILKNRMVISRIATSKNHIELLVPARSDLRPDSWSWANSGLDTTSRIFENEKIVGRSGRVKQRQSTAVEPRSMYFLKILTFHLSWGCKWKRKK